jgi:hypothetical protein
MFCASRHHGVFFPSLQYPLYKEEVATDIEMIEIIARLMNVQLHHLWNAEEV